MSELDDVRKAALREAEEAHVIEVRAEPEVVLVGEPIRITARFFSRGTHDIGHLSPIDVTLPVVEIVGKVHPGEQRTTRLDKIRTGEYDCTVTAKSPGTRAYKLKESEEEDTGELFEVEVLNREGDNILRGFFDRLAKGGP